MKEIKHKKFLIKTLIWSKKFMIILKNILIQFIINSFF